MCREQPGRNALRIDLNNKLHHCMEWR